jgi:hypothetical protein
VLAAEIRIILVQCKYVDNKVVKRKNITEFWNLNGMFFQVQEDIWKTKNPVPE